MIKVTIIVACFTILFVMGENNYAGLWYNIVLIIGVVFAFLKGMEDANRWTKKHLSKNTKQKNL